MTDSERALLRQDEVEKAREWLKGNRRELLLILMGDERFGGGDLANTMAAYAEFRLAAARAGEGEATRFEVLRHVCLACGHEIDTTMCSYQCEFDASTLGERPAESWTRRVYAVTETLLREGKDVRAESLQPVAESVKEGS